MKNKSEKFLSEILKKLKKNVGFSLCWQKSQYVKIKIKTDKQTIITLFEFFFNSGFYSKQEQILRLMDRPELLAGQIISFYNEKKKLRIDVELE